MNLKQWAERNLTTVGEKGDHVSTISLKTTDGMSWHTWRGPFRNVEDWVDDAERVVAELAEDWPKQKVQLMFLAEDQSGNVLSQCTKVVTGKAGHATDHVFGGQGKALAESMDAQARTMDRILTSAYQHVEMLSKTLEMQGRALEAARTEVMMARLRELEEKPAVNPELVQQALQMLPAVLEAIMTRSPAPAAAAAASAAASAAGVPPVNGSN